MRRRPASSSRSSSSKPGDLLVQIETRDVQNQYDQVAAQLAAAKSKLDVSTAQKKRADDLFKSRIITASGKQLPIDEVWKRVKANSVIVFSGSYEAPAEAYLRTLSAEAVVIIPGAGAINENRPPPPVPEKKKT